MTERDVIITKVTELYVGILGRAPDYAGLQYWVDQILNDTLSLENTRASFASPNQAEYWNIYGGLSNGELVDAIYSNYLERAPDVDGRAYWIDELNTDSVAADQMINAIINAVQDTGATNPQTLIDAQVLENKVAAAITFVTAAKDITVDASFITQAQAAVSEVSSDSASVTSATAATESYVDSQPAAISGTYVAELGAEHSATLTFFSNGAYVQIQNVADGDMDKDGFEVGSWTFDTDSSLLNITVDVDTNGGAGVTDGPGSVSLSASFTHSDLTVEFEDGTLVMPKLVGNEDKPEVGSWLALYMSDDGSIQEGFAITNFFTNGLFTALDYDFSDVTGRFVTAGSYTFGDEQLSGFDITAWTDASSDPEGFTEAMVANIDDTLIMSGVDEYGSWSDVLYSIA